MSAPSFKIFLSSTGADLTQHRDLVPTLAIEVLEAHYSKTIDRPADVLQQEGTQRRLGAPG